MPAMMALLRGAFRVIPLAFALNCTGAGPASAQFTRFQPFAEDQGLGNASVSAIGQDRDGFVLLGTEAGLYCYDGAGVVPCSGNGDLPSGAWIRNIAADRSGRLWIATTHGLFLRSPAAAGLRRVDPGTAIDLRTPHLFAVSDAEVVAAGADGRLRHATVGIGGAGTFAPLLPDAILSAIPALRSPRFVVADPPGGWLIGAGTTLFRFRDGRVEDLGIAAALPPDRWEIARRDARGAIWARSLTRVAMLRPNDAASVVATVPDAADPFYAHEPERLDMLPDRTGGAFTQSADGLLRWDGRTWKRYRSHDGGLSSNPIQALTLDREGSLWVGTVGHGAFRDVGLGLWEHWTAADGLPSDVVWSMARAGDGALWVATYTDTVALGAGNVHLPGGSENVAVSASDRIWTAPAGGVLRRLDRDRARSDDLPFADEVLSMTVDEQDRLWLSAQSGLWMVADADAPVSALRPVRVLAGKASSVLVDAAGTVWAAMAGGLYRSGPSGRFDLVLDSAAIGGRPVCIAVAAPDEVWLSSEHADGIHRFRLGDGKPPERLAPIAVPVIGSNSVEFIHRDRRGSLWIGTDHGIDRFDGRTWRHVDHGEGPISDDMNDYAVFEDRDGSLLFGTSHG
ncbi:MAG: hypothetical protein INR65_04490, partial [Gluconacetobacter diazotrophicus]|nr:hypothetical protein [Gluconacetobacter diazotrophicus]